MLVPAEMASTAPAKAKGKHLSTAPADKYVKVQCVQKSVPRIIE
jgi:hypothetical protein